MKHLFIKKHQRQGLAILLSILVILLATKLSLKYWLKPNYKLEAALPLSDIEVQEKTPHTDKTYVHSPKGIPKEKKQYSGKKEPRILAASIIIDINTTPYDSLAMLPVPKYVIRNIEKYRKAGGKYRKKEDLKKIYGLTPEMYASIEKHIKIEQTTEKRRAQYQKKRTPRKEARSSKEKNAFKSKSYAKKPYKKMVRVDLNTCKPEDLRKIPGIGAYFSKTIVKYRNLLGGYHNKEQLMEVYKMKEETYDKIKNYVIIEAPKLKKININTANSKELSRHPYISRKAAKIILKYRKNHGSYTSLEDLGKVKVITKQNLAKLAPYISYD